MAKKAQSGKSYSQVWPAYNKAQTNEKRHFLYILHELCRHAETSQQPEGLHRLPINDILFTVAFKVYSTLSTRRFICDLNETQAKGLISRVPHFNSISLYMRMESLTKYLEHLIKLSSLPLKSFEVDFAADSTGMSTHQLFEWYSARYGRKKIKRDWVKIHVMCGVCTNIITSAYVTTGRESDTAQFERLVKDTSTDFKMSEISADSGYLAASNMRLALLHGAVPYIRFKSDSTADGEFKSEFWKRMLYLYKERHREFSRHYNKRNNVESTFSMLKAKFGGCLRSKDMRSRINESLCKVLCHNICVLIQSLYEFGIELNFSDDAAGRSKVHISETITNAELLEETLSSIPSKPKRKAYKKRVSIQQMKLF